MAGLYVLSFLFMIIGIFFLPFVHIGLFALLCIWSKRCRNIESDLSGDYSYYDTIAKNMPTTQKAPRRRLPGFPIGNGSLPWIMTIIWGTLCLISILYVMGAFCLAGNEGTGFYLVFSQMPGVVLLLGLALSPIGFIAGYYMSTCGSIMGRILAGTVLFILLAPCSVILTVLLFVFVEIVFYCFA